MNGIRHTVDKHRRQHEESYQDLRNKDMHGEDITTDTEVLSDLLSVNRGMDDDQKLMYALYATMAAIMMVMTAGTMKVRLFSSYCEAPMWMSIISTYFPS